MNKLFKLFYTALIFMVGCSKSGLVTLEGLTDVNATAIAFDADGKIFDFVHVEPNSDIDWIEFRAPESGEQLFVTAIGPRVSAALSGRIFSSRRQEGFMGKVLVDVEQDTIVSMSGNGFSTDNPLTIKEYEWVRSELQNENRKLSDMVSVIKINVHLQDLIETPEGNLVPKDMSLMEDNFLSGVIPALQTGNVDTLARYIHKNPRDKTGMNSVRDFLKLVASKRIERFRFMEFDPDHPENKEMMTDFEGGPYRYSLPIEKVLTVYFSRDSALDVLTHADLLIGNDNGALKFPTKYADF